MGVSARSWYFIRDKYQFDSRLENNSLRKTSIAQNYVLLMLPLTKFFVFHLLSWTFPVFILFYFTLFYFIYNYGRTKTKWKISDLSGIPLPNKNLHSHPLSQCRRSNAKKLKHARPYITSFQRFTRWFHTQTNLLFLSQKDFLCNPLNFQPK